jgi:hypothetical protein
MVAENGAGACGPKKRQRQGTEWYSSVQKETPVAYNTLVWELKRVMYYYYATVYLL